MTTDGAYGRGDNFPDSPLPTKQPFFELYPHRFRQWQENPTKNARGAADAHKQHKYSVPNPKEVSLCFWIMKWFGVRRGKNPYETHHIFGD